MSALIFKGRQRVWAAGLVLLALGGGSLRAQERALRPVRVVEKRALLIGNARYEGTTPLLNTIPDVRALEGALQDLGFQAVTREENLTLREMMAAVRGFTSGLEAGDLAFFYYSGHGVQVERENYLLPVDFERETQPGEVAYAALAVRRVQDMLKGTGAKVRVLVLDACRNNPFGDGRSAGGGLAAMDADGDLIVYSTGAGDVASDNAAGELGLYMTHLLPELRRERVELKGAFDRARAAVYEAATARGESQRPAQYEDLIGRVYLRGGPSDPSAEASSPFPLTPLQAESIRISPPSRETTAAEHWEEIKGTERPEVLEEYVRSYQGESRAQIWVRLANLRLKELELIGLNAEAQTAWSAVRDMHSAGALEAFIETYGNVPGAADLVREATERLEALRLPEIVAERWKEIQGTESPETLVAYIAQFEDKPGTADWVRLAIARLKTVQSKRLENKVRTEWAAVREMNSTDAIEAFIEAYGKVKGAVDIVEQAGALLKTLRGEWTNSVGIEFVLVPPGVFRMGSTSDQADKDERRVTRVRISRAFHLGKYEVTQGQWEAVMGDNPSEFDSCGRDCPVENVSWDDVQQFLRKLNEKEVGESYKLPTEAEWEYAARAGTIGERYGDIEVIAWYAGNSGRRKHPVGQMVPNEFGLHDMQGNVSEWVQDRHGKYPGGEVTDPVGAKKSYWTGNEGYRVIRGCDFTDSAYRCRSASRGLSERDEPSTFWKVGFRLLREVY